MPSYVNPQTGLLVHANCFGLKFLKPTFAGKEIGVPDIRKAELGNDAGIIGAAMLEHYGFRRGGSNTNRNGGKQYA